MVKPLQLTTAGVLEAAWAIEKHYINISYYYLRFHGQENRKEKTLGLKTPPHKNVALHPTGHLLQDKSLPLQPTTPGGLQATSGFSRLTQDNRAKPWVFVAARADKIFLGHFSLF